MGTKSNESLRFGFSEDLMASVLKEHLALGVYRCGCYVPTEDEVYTMPLTELKDVLIDWLWESPSELIPNDGQLDSVKLILEKRAPSKLLDELITECDNFLAAK